MHARRIGNTMFLRYFIVVHCCAGQEGYSQGHKRRTKHWPAEEAAHEGNLHVKQCCKTENKYHSVLEGFNTFVSSNEWLCVFVL